MKSEWIVIGTVEAHIRYNYDIRAICRNCRHQKMLDLQMLADRLGGDHSTLRPDLAPKLSCSRCGARNPELFTITNAKMGLG